MSIFIEHKYFLYNVNENWLQMQKITPDKEQTIQKNRLPTTHSLQLIFRTIGSGACFPT